MYAKGTDVSVSKSKAEIESTLHRYGASAIGSFVSTDRATIMFEAKDRRLRFDLPLPSKRDRRITHHSRGPRDQAGVEAAWEQACRQRWRALLLCIKAKLESVESGIETFEEAFLAHIVLPDGKTVAEHAAPRIAQAYAGGEVPALLPPRSSC